jgi:chaperonin cofactor prefoldin
MEDELKAHLEAMEARLDAKIEKVEARLDTKIEAMEARLDAKIEKVETTLLTEFHKWASPAELRARSHAAAIRALDLETEALTERVAKLEKQG